MDDSPHSIPARTTPTWELELLISGATVFGLLQLPDRLDAFLVAWINGTDATTLPFVMPLGVYLQFAVTMLVLTFVLHLCLRGYWVALVGLHSVYPEGIRWERLRLGHFNRQAVQQAMGSMDDRIEAADNRASRTFAVGFGLAMAMLLPIVVVGLAIALLQVARFARWDLGTVKALLLVALAVLILPQLLAHGIDRFFAARLAPEGRLARAVRGTLRVYANLGFSRVNNPLLALYRSQFEGKMAGFVIGALMLPAMILASARMLGDRIPWERGLFAGLPEADSGSIATLPAARYDSLRGEARTLVPQPFIPDPVASGPYLRLFVPYVPFRYNDALAKQCPDALEPAAVERGEALACIARLHALTLDGKSVGVPWLASRDAKTGQRGAVVMVPIAALAEGQHELTLTSLPSADDKGKVLRIPFWK